MKSSAHPPGYLVGKNNVGLGGVSSGHTEPIQNDMNHFQNIMINPGGTYSSSNITQIESTRHLNTKFMSPRATANLNETTDFVFAGKYFPLVEETSLQQELANQTKPAAEINGEESNDKNPFMKKKQSAGSVLSATLDSSGSNPIELKYFTSKINTRSNSTASLLQKEKSHQAIQQYQAASKKLRSLLKDQDESQTLKKNSKMNVTPDKLTKFSLQKKMNPFSSGASSTKDLKGLSLDLNKQYLDPKFASLMDSTKNSKPIVYPFSSTKVEENEKRIISAIDGSQFSQEKVTWMQNGLGEGQRKWNQLIQQVKEKEFKLRQMKQEWEQLGKEEIMKAEEAKASILELDSQIAALDEQIYEQERKQETLIHMKTQRLKDLQLNSKPLVAHFTVIQHLIRFLSKSQDALHAESKEINQIFREMVESYKEKQRHKNLSSQYSTMIERKIHSDEEAVRLAEFENVMRDRARKDERNQRKQKAEDIRQIQKEEERQKNALAFSLQEQMDHFNAQFLDFHHSHPIVSSYRDLLTFCKHVKENTIQLQNDKNEEIQKQKQLNSEVALLKSELDSLKFSTQTKTDELIIQHNQTRVETTLPFSREDDFIDIQNLEQQLIVEQHKLEILEDHIRRKMQNQHSVLVQLNGIHDRIAIELKKGNSQHSRRINLKIFDFNFLEESLKGLINSIGSLSELLFEIENEKQTKPRKVSILSRETRYPQDNTQLFENINNEEGSNVEKQSSNPPQEQVIKTLELPVNENLLLHTQNNSTNLNV